MALVKNVRVFIKTALLLFLSMAELGLPPLGRTLMGPFGSLAGCKRMETGIGMGVRDFAYS
jgi:hypothetical protein